MIHIALRLHPVAYQLVREGCDRIDLHMRVWGSNGTSRPFRRGNKIASNRMAERAPLAGGSDFFRCGGFEMNRA